MEDDEQGADPVVEDEIYEVDRILQTKMHGRKRMFLVRWKNYGEEADSWEPEDLLLDGAEETVKEFMLKYEEEKQTKKKVIPIQNMLSPLIFIIVLEYPKERTTF